MNRFRVLTALGAALIALAGCSTASMPVNPSPAAALRTAATSSEVIYVANHTAVSVYEAGGKLIRRVSTGLSAPAALAVDANGRLYVANRGNSTVVVFGRGGTGTPRTIRDGISQPRALAFDQQGNLYVGNKGNGTVTIYAPNKSAPTLTIANVDPHALTFDALNHLYVGNPGLNEILEYNASSSTSIHTVHTHNGPLGIGVDANEILYCVNNNNVTVYSPTATTPTNQIVDGTNFPSTLALFGSKLYIANWGVNPTQSTVTVYSTANRALLQTIRNGIGNPLALAVDKSGNLFVVNSAYSTVSVYAPGKTVPRTIISSGIRQPVAIAVSG